MACVKRQAPEKKKRAAGKKGWTTEEQRVWFEAKLPAFISAQTAGNPSAFITEAKNEWFEKWPELPLLFGPAAVLEDLTEAQRQEYGAALAAHKQVSPMITSLFSILC